MEQKLPPYTSFTQQEVMNRVLEQLATGDVSTSGYALRVWMTNPIQVQVDEIDIGNVGLLNLDQDLINPATKEGVAELEAAFVQETLTEFDEAPSVASLGSATVIQYTVPAGKMLFLQCVKVSGSNYGVFNLRVGGTVKERCRTHDGSLEGKMLFSATSAKDGIPVPAGTIVEVTVFNPRPFSGDYECTLYGKLV